MYFLMANWNKYNLSNRNAKTPDKNGESGLQFTAIRTTGTTHNII